MRKNQPEMRLQGLVELSTISNGSTTAHDWEPLSLFFAHSSRSAFFLQHSQMGRPSLVQVKIDLNGERITGVSIGGQCYFMGNGWITLPD